MRRSVNERGNCFNGSSLYYLVCLLFMSTHLETLVEEVKQIHMYIVATVSSRKCPEI